MSIDDAWNTRYRPLAQRMREAAQTIREANARYGFGVNAPWSPYALDNEAPHIEAEDGADVG